MKRIIFLRHKIITLLEKYNSKIFHNSSSDPELDIMVALF